MPSIATPVADDLPLLTTPASPPWVDVQDLDDALEEVEAKVGNPVRQVMELSWEDWSDVADDEAFEHQVRVWPHGQVDVRSLGSDSTGMADAPLREDVSKMDERERGAYVRFSSLSEANTTLAEHARQLYFWVDQYEHGSIDLAVTGTRYGEGFDVSQRRGLYIAPAHEQAEYKILLKTMPPAQVRAGFVTRANERLSDHARWLNGEVFTLDVRSFDPQGKLKTHETLGGIFDQSIVDDLCDNVLGTPVVAPSRHKPSL